MSSQCWGPAYADPPLSKLGSQGALFRSKFTPSGATSFPLHIDKLLIDLLYRLQLLPTRLIDVQTNFDVFASRDGHVPVAAGYLGRLSATRSAVLLCQVNRDNQRV